MNDNPYAAPTAEITEGAATGGRPGWVWVISIYYVFGAGASLLSYAMVLSGALPLPPAQKAYWQSLTLVDHALSVTVVVTNLVAAISLFRLRRPAVYLFPAAFGTGLLITLWHIISKGWINVMGEGGHYRALAGWLISLLICLYAWRLANKGVLR